MVQKEESHEPPYFWLSVQESMCEGVLPVYLACPDESQRDKWVDFLQNHIASQPLKLNTNSIKEGYITKTVHGKKPSITERIVSNVRCYCSFREKAWRLSICVTLSCYKTDSITTSVYAFYLIAVFPQHHHKILSIDVFFCFFFSFRSVKSEPTGTIFLVGGSVAKKINEEKSNVSLSQFVFLSAGLLTLVSC